MPWKLTRPEPPSWDDVGGDEDEGAPVAAVDGEVGDEVLVEGLRDLGLVGVEDGGIGGDMTSVVTAAGGQRGVDGEDLADGEDEVFAVDLAEGAAAER